MKASDMNERQRRNDARINKAIVRAMVKRAYANLIPPNDNDLRPFYVLIIIFLIVAYFLLKNK